MSLKHVLEAIELLDGWVTGNDVREALERHGLSPEIATVQGERGRTDFVNVTVAGKAGKSVGGSAPTVGIIGRLGGVGARPARIGLVSDGDGAVAALAIAFKIGDMRRRGDVLPGDVMIATHVCPDAPVTPHEPVPFMGSPVDMETLNRMEVDPLMDAILSVDTTRGNRTLNRRGIAITPVVKEGYILPISDGILDVFQNVTGELPVVLPLTTYDITPYDNGLPHVNSIVQPSTAVSSPVMGVAIVSCAAVPGCATGATQAFDIDAAVRFCIEVAKVVTAGDGHLFDQEAYERAVRLYGRLSVLQAANGQPAISR
ncbi:MAG: DUF1177 domain-containing protein [Firmicutes bacterium]|jgi:hypothetical protein|nr:DUF1177 domain-containing protein [Bacillota bacterium]MDH7494776.1 DUF1177 domain-containing protein [Bacillota bacterium]